MKQKSKRRSKWLKRMSVSLVLGLLVFPGFIAIANAQVLQAANGKTFDEVESIPHHRVGIVLGCSPTIGRYKNPYFVGRINAAVKLYEAGKVDRLLVSGDNGRQTYDEPTAMEQALIAKGIPKNHIAKDFAGFRTLDTMVRANKVFGLTDATIITDDFHVARSLYFAQAAGITADAFPSIGLSNAGLSSTEVREIMARGQAVLDETILQSQPKFLGRQESIP
jgi:SanA protein